MFALATLSAAAAAILYGITWAWERYVEPTAYVVGSGADATPVSNLSPWGAPQR